MIADQLGNMLTVQHNNLRIVCLVPSITETLYDLGLEDEVVGITKFCVHPRQWHQSKTRIGGTKQVKHDVIASLKPTLIITNKEENTKEDVEQLQALYPTYISDISNVSDAIRMIEDIGALTNTSNKATILAARINELAAQLNPSKYKRALYAIWYKPWMFAGADTFITQMLAVDGYTNSCTITRYPILSLEEIAAYKPEAILLSSEPFPFKEKHIAELQTILPNADIKLVDGELYSWYGSRIIKALESFTTNAVS
ncbi:MAG: hypothetical protein RL660_1292 [Bacteroidota bacterium]|jgi:ABC-type Fe3+-hydroxamate transport system substrate-binding protein